MPSAVLVTLAALAALYFANCCKCLAVNVIAARKSGIPYVVTPWYRFNIIWLLTGDRLYPYLDRLLPRSWTQSWLPYLRVEWNYETKYEPFRRLGSDVLFVCSPGANQLYVANPEAIVDITTRRLDFPKPLEIYKTLQLYGENVVVTEGAHWRRHRKLTTPSFSEKNNRVVWDESLQQSQAILAHWTRGHDSSPTLHGMDADMMSLSLHIISKAGFGVRCLWPHEESAGVEGQDERLTSSKPPPGHTMSYKEAMSKLMKNVIWIPILPKWLCGVLPFEGPRAASVAYDEWGMYMKELYEMKKTHILEERTTEGLDLLGSVMRGAGITEKTLSGSEPQNQQLSDSEILGNAFIFILAGHETTANAMHFALVLLALNPQSQRRLQQDISDAVGGRPVSQWDYDQDLPKLMNGMPAAVIYETLRMIPAVVGIPKRTPKDSAQPLVVDGRNYVVPADSLIAIHTPGVHNHPKHWPTRPDISALPPGDELEQFKPERWMVDENNQPLVNGHGAASGKAPQLFKPAPGVFVPFSEGHRSCMGRRFAQVESISVIAALMQTHSVELAVDGFADDEQVAAMPRGGPERKEVWQKAADKAVDVVKNGLGTIITLQMRRGHVPLRIVKRGEERFLFDEQ